MIFTLLSFVHLFCCSGKQGVRFQGEGSRLFRRHRQSGLGGSVCVEMLIKKLIPLV